MHVLVQAQPSFHLRPLVRCSLALLCSVASARRLAIPPERSAIDAAAFGKLATTSSSPRLVACFAFPLYLASQPVAELARPLSLYRHFPPYLPFSTPWSGRGDRRAASGRFEASSPAAGGQRRATVTFADSGARTTRQNTSLRFSRRSRAHGAAVFLFCHCDCALRVMHAPLR